MDDHDAQSVASLLRSTNSKIQQLQKAFAELESHRAVTTLNLKWKQIEDHFHGLEKSLKRRFTVLEEQEKEFEIKTVESQQMLEKRQAAVLIKEEASLEKLQEKRDEAVTTISFIFGQNTQPAKNILKLTENDLKMLSNPQLVQLCKDMDSEGLHKFISDNRKNLASIKTDIPIALKAASDPGGLILDSLTGFYTPNLDGKKDSNLLGLQRTCIMLMECLSLMLTDLDSNIVCKIISKDVKTRAKIILEDWKPKLNDLDVDASNGNSLEAHAFLQLVATFGIDSGFLQDDLVKLIPMVSRRRQTADLCRFLGLANEMTGVIDVLVNSGRHIDAVNLTFAFELTNQFSPVSLLKSYLTESKRHSSPTTQNDTIEKELSALKSVIKCIEDHKLEDQYPLGPLQKRVHHLEKAKAEKKRATETSKPQLKRPRAANGLTGYGARNTPDKNFYPRMTERYQPPPPPPPQYMYDNRTYGYHTPPDNHHMPPFIGGGAVTEGGGYPFLGGGMAYNMAPNHGSYFGNGYQYQGGYIQQVCRHGP